MKIYKFSILVLCASVGACFLRLIHQTFPDGLRSPVLWLGGARMDEPRIGLITALVLSYCIPILITVDLYKLTQRVLRGCKNRGPTLTSGELTATFTVFMLVWFLYDKYVVHSNSWDIIRSMPDFVGVASLGVVSSTGITNARAVAKPTLRDTTFYWIILYVLENAVYWMCRWI